MASLQKIGYAFVTLLWLLALALAIFVPWPWLVVILLALHLCELIVVGYRTGRRDGHGPVWCVIMCLLFGFVWWLPIKQKLDPQ